MFQRRQVKTHSRLMREELGESLDHLRMAAAHAADSASSALAPRVTAARKAVQPGMKKARNITSSGMDTMLGAARDGSRGARKIARNSKAKASKKGSGMTRARWPMLIGGILAAGAAFGAASALMKRRQGQHTWDEYGATRTTDDTGSMLDSAKSTMDAGIEKASTMAEAAKDRASDLVGSKTTNIGPTGDYNKQPTTPNSTTDTFSGTGSKNSRP